MIALLHFRDFVVRPVLRTLLLTECFDAAVMTAAERLLIGTALAESRLEFLAQVGGGPALGVYQMEPATHDDIWARYLAGRPGLAARVRSFAGQGGPSPGEMAGNLYYATAMARIHYLRAPGSRRRKGKGKWEDRSKAARRGECSAQRPSRSAWPDAPRGALIPPLRSGPWPVRRWRRSWSARALPRWPARPYGTGSRASMS